jgi:hypothetical protein
MVRACAYCDIIERECAFKEVGAIDLIARKGQSDSDRFDEWSCREATTWTTAPKGELSGESESIALIH